MSERFIQDHLVAMGKEPHQKISAMAGKMQGVLKLAGGDPDFDTPKHIRDAAVKALDQGRTHYPPMPGLQSIREAIAKYHGKYGIDSCD